MELLSGNKKRVNIFLREIEIDKSLPKYQKLNIEDNNDTNTSGNSGEAGEDKINVGELKQFLGDKDSSSFNIKIKKELLERLKKEPNNSNLLFESEEFMDLGLNNTESINIKFRMKRFFIKLLELFGVHAYALPSRTTKSDKKDKKYTLNLLDVFKNIKLKSKEQKIFIERLRQYKDLINKANSLGQVAQEEKLIDGLVTHVYESILYSSGFLKYIEEDDLIELQKKCKKQLSLDYIKNFIRVIPDDVAEKKREADSLMVFDNYVILHYDPEAKSTSMTKKEELEKVKKDPVLFGVIRGSNKLYYIADWVDEFCDLTLEKIVEKIGYVKSLK